MGASTPEEERHLQMMPCIIQSAVMAKESELPWQALASDRQEELEHWSIRKDGAPLCWRPLTRSQLHRSRKRRRLFLTGWKGAWDGPPAKLPLGLVLVETEEMYFGESEPADATGEPLAIPLSGETPLDDSEPLEIPLAGEKPSGANELGAGNCFEIPLSGEMPLVDSEPAVATGEPLDIPLSGKKPFGAIELGATSRRRRRWLMGMSIAKGRLWRLRASWREQARRAWHGQNPLDTCLDIVEGLSPEHGWVDVLQVVSLARCRSKSVYRWHGRLGIGLEPLETWESLGILRFSPDREMVKLEVLHNR